ncbi:phosphotransferase enzyme family protein [Pseudactinotalea suaedae]|uniref:phosphotransferase enzyme family protein n=1 Tax=Pseudactinotalea suaedae TaxID=1524924 RepID=UPI0012E27CD7|nr:aminoglycoside phosphotransferase family protein [Pseudactinotalea suaedae]
MDEGVMRAIEACYPLHVVALSRVDAGTASDNFVVSSDAGERWFAKVYRAGADIEAAEGAIALSSFARAGGSRVPAVHLTGGGEVVARAAGVALSLWELVDDAVTAEGGLVGQRWKSVGREVGLLHRRLALHPVGAPALRPASAFVDLAAAAGAYDRLIAAYRRGGTADPYQEWALEAATVRRGLLPEVGALLERLPELTVQVVHGDLAAPNVLLRGDDVAAIIDFQPPRPAYLAWEIARIACDPRTVVADDSWIESLPLLLDAYREAYPAVRDEDLDAVVALGCAYTLASTYPLAEPLVAPAVVRSEHAEMSLQRYGRARHDAALLMLEHLGT